MGGLTATLSVDHVTQSERSRSSSSVPLPQLDRSDIARSFIGQLSATPSSEYKAADTGFSYSKARRKVNMDRIVTQTRQADPSGADQMAKLFASTDVVTEIGEGIAPYGLRTDNVADALTVYMMTAWQASNGDTSDFTQAQVNGARAQSTSALMNTPEFTGATDEVKQELAELYLVQAALIQATVDVAQTDPKIASGLAKAVKQGAKASGVNLDLMVLTSDGFEPRRGGDASDAVPLTLGESEEALADAGTANSGDSEEKTTTYALIAAAGAGTLAAVFGLGKMMGRRG